MGKKDWKDYHWKAMLFLIAETVKNKGTFPNHSTAEFLFRSVEHQSLNIYIKHQEPKRLLLNFRGLKGDSAADFFKAKEGNVIRNRLMCFFTLIYCTMQIGSPVFLNIRKVFLKNLLYINKQ